MLSDLGVGVDHMTLFRWVQTYAGTLECGCGDLKTATRLGAVGDFGLYPDLRRRGSAHGGGGREGELPALFGHGSAAGVGGRSVMPSLARRAA